MNKKTLILDTTGIDWTDRQIASHDGIDVDCIYKPHCLPLRALRRYHLRSILAGKFIWYGNWFQNMNYYDTIIIFSDIKSISIFKDIRNNGYQGELCFYYRDPVSRKPYRPDDIRTLQANVFLSTFDPADAAKYNMFFNPQFFFREVATQKIDTIYDAVSISSDRGRLSEIISTKSILDKEGLKSYFFILKDKRKVYPKDLTQKDIILSNKSLSYENILALNQQSRAIVEINAKGQIGLTNRAMEALFLGKKLITNNHDIINLGFYHPDNIYIIGMNRESISIFLDKPYYHNTSRVIDYYDFDSWLKRMQMNSI